MSNVKFRYALEEKVFRDGNRVNRNTHIKPYTSEEGNVGNSKAYTAIAVYPDAKFFDDKVAPNQTIYFKANSQVGINANGRCVVDEERGSCEDVAEVLAYYLLDCLRSAYPGEIVIEPTPYFFAEFENEYFAAILKKQTDGLIDGVYSTLYGCVSPDILEDGAKILHGAEVLSGIGRPIDEHKLMSRNNTIYNYAKALGSIKSKKIVVSPDIPRQLASTMFFSYFYCDTDKHCQNITFQSIPHNYGKQIIKLTKILDNGGGMLMQSTNCKKFYEEQKELIQQEGEIKEYQNGVRNPFYVYYDLSIGSEIFADPEIQKVYKDLSYEEQLVLLISQNRILFDDFRKFYEGLDFNQALSRLMQSTGRTFLPELCDVLPHVFDYKRMCISRAIASMLGEEFNEELFHENPSYYLDRLDGMVLEDALTVHIASNEEIEHFNEQNGLATNALKIKQ